MSKLFSLLVFLLAGYASQAQLPSFVRDSLDTYVLRAMKEWKIPGVSVCVVKDGKAVVMKGYGVRTAGGNEPVDENTLFMIGSNTKAFTATALAKLAAEGKLSLDDKVKRWLPDFTLFDPWVARETTVRDLLCHRLGFETFQGDFMYFDSDLSKAEVRQKFGQVKPAYSFRSRWGYTNAAFLTAGEIIPAVTGKSWEEYVHDSIFLPLQMNRSLTVSKDMEQASNKSSAHTMVEGKIVTIPYGRLENMAPAGSISSSVKDMSNWLIMQLDSGRFHHQQVIPFSAIVQTRTPASILGNGGTLFNRGHFALYGLGWFLEEYSGRKIVSHTGGVNGFVTSVTLVPEEKLGIVVFTNTDANSFYEALKWELLDAFLDLPYRNYSKTYLGFAGRQQEAQEKWLKQKKDTVALHLSPTLPPEAIEGVYRHAVYGTMNIKKQDGKLVATFEHHKGRFAILEPLGGNRYLASFNDPLYGTRVWPFTITNGKAQSVTVTVADFVEFTPYEFVRE